MPDRHGGPVCGMCHVYVSEPWFKYMKNKMHPIENVLLEKDDKPIQSKYVYDNYLVRD
jgi:hypothetical protein